MKNEVITPVKSVDSNVKKPVRTTVPLKNRTATPAEIFMAVLIMHR